MADGKRREQKSTTKAKPKATSQEERIYMRKQHFENLLAKERSRR